VGYDGGRIVSEQLADHAVVVRSDYIPRIQEVQASIYHVLRGLIEQVRAEN
jgi:D-sedoheptulose 7-phosphate isomerase